MAAQRSSGTSPRVRSSGSPAGNDVPLLLTRRRPPYVVARRKWEQGCASRRRIRLAPQSVPWVSFVLSWKTVYDKNQYRKCRQLHAAEYCSFCLAVQRLMPRTSRPTTTWPWRFIGAEVRRVDSEFKAAYKLNPKSPRCCSIWRRPTAKPDTREEAVEHYDLYLSATPQLDGETRHKVDGYLAEARNTLAS